MTGTRPAFDLGHRSTRIFGREDDLRLLRSLMDDSRLVTLTGAGGCGKTRLAIQLLTSLDPAERNIIWVDLAALTDPSLVAKAIGSALGLADRPGADPADWLTVALRGRAVVLALDNCEHVVDAVARLVERLLAGSPELVVLTTSRESLGVEGEATYRVPSLIVPGQGASFTEVTSSPAVALFADRAAKARPGFAVSEDNCDAVAEICQRLNGIPLALELAAARISMMTPSQVAAGMGDRFHLLTGGRRTAMPRQRTLEASVDWSYELLSEDERLVLRTLSVFAGSFDLETALEICAGGADQLLDVIARLVDHSLVHVDVSRPVARYRLLETVRAFVLTRLVSADEAQQARDRHVAAYRAMAERVEPEFFGPRLAAAVCHVDLEVDNFRAAMDWAAASGDCESALHIGGGLWMYWFVRSRHAEGLSRLRGLLDEATEAPPLLRYKVIVATLLLSLSSDLRGALPLAQEAVDIAESVGDPGMLSQAKAWLGQVQHLQGLSDGSELLVESLRLARISQDSAHIGRSLQWLGSLRAMQGEASAGIVLLDEAVALFRATGNLLQLGWALMWRGITARFAGDLSGAMGFQTESLALMGDRGEETFAAVVLTELASLALLRGELASAERYVTQAMGVARLSVAPLVEGLTLMVQVQLAEVSGDDGEAFRLASASAEAIEASGSVLMTGFALIARARASLRSGDNATAHASLERALMLSGGVPSCRARALLAHAELARAEDSLASVDGLLFEALQTAFEGQDLIAVVDALEALAARPQDDGASSVRLLTAAERCRQELGYVPLPESQRLLDTLTHNLRESLGVDYEKAAAEGAVLSVEQAVAYAVRGRGHRNRPTAGWDSLTPTERDVAGLVAEGLSNPEIAARLFVSRNTVKAHLAHAFAKLGVANRSELASVVTRHEG